ncbi:zinc finger protein 395-like [Carassius auratus]|uniref:Zinc finger protein 395-like n=1 Tax=Carassius auratus TaxID=7957 RepID=A0A6P6LM16_CARAU|nr:zinc finger protein 395-like [Carassius auratus]XP_026085564.1 zinc finger protein 395-like [Carassius auratus]
MLPKTRLGKRSPLGTLVCGSSAEGLTETGPLGCLDSGPHRSKLYPGQKVYVHCGGQECGGVVEQHNHVDNEVSIFLPQLNQHVHRKLEDVWTSPTSSHTTSVSSSIDVPRRSTDTVDMDEIMAAMVLTSLSCSPVIQHSAPVKATQASCRMENGGGELYDGGYWSCDHGNGSPAPSPPITEMDKSAPLIDEGLDMELDQMLFNEPTPRKRKNSVKVAYRCLWPNCGKILTTVVGIKRHIRNSHLGHSDEHSQREEDFYYTEVYQDLEQTTPSGGHVPSCTSPSSPSRHTPPCSSPTTPEMHQPSPLSQSAPGSFWQVHSEHSYQAPPPIQVVTPSKPVSVPVSCHWTPSLTVHQSKQGSPFRRRSVSVGEQWLQNNNATFKPLPASVSPPRNHCTSRRIRGEAKKCRKVYGIEHRDQWCTACRWKKACQRFLD